MAIKKKDKIPASDIAIFKSFQKSPLPFIKIMWGLSPQPVKPEYKDLVNTLITDKNYKEVKAIHFNPFIRGKHITWQQWLITLAVENSLTPMGKKRISIASGHGIGKELCNLSEILMYDGTWKKNGKLITGDIIWGKDGKPTKILAVYPQGKKPLYRVTFDDGSSILAGLEHQWTIKGRQQRREKKNWITITTKDIIDAGVKRSNGTALARQWEIPQLEPLNGPTHVPDAYTIGVWLGDGTSTSSVYTKPDQQLREEIYTDGYNLSEQKSKGTQTVYGLRTRLKELGIFNNKKAGLPKNFLSWNVSSKKRLLAGLVDTDGTIGVKTNNIEFGTIHKKLAEDTLLLIRSLGGKGRINIKPLPKFTYKEEIRTGKKYYRVSFQTPFNPFVLKRKASLWHKPQGRYLSRWVESIKYEKDALATCIQVDNPESLYVAGRDLIVTHNSSLNAMLIIWFLYSFPCSNVPCTAPTGDQLQGALWKELAVWLAKMPEQEAERFELQNDHLRVHDSGVKGSDRLWWARARTGKKENPEALAGIHSKNVMVIVDEASGVHDKVFEVMEGALTEENVIVLMITNYTRNAGYFHNSQTKLKHLHQCFSFSSVDSPIPSDGYNEQIIALYGKDSDQYRVRVLGLPPKEEAVDERGFMPLITTKEIIQINDVSKDDFINPVMGVDPAGEGTDKATVVIRDQFRAKVVLEEKISNPKRLAQRVVGLMEYYSVPIESVYVDMFGTGAELVKEMALARFDTKSITVGEKPEDDEDKRIYINKRAMAYFRLKRWLREGGELVQHPTWDDELTSLRYCRNLSSKMQIMSKKDMRTLGFPSPNSADALMLTFIEESHGMQITTINLNKQQPIIGQQSSQSDDSYAAI